MSKLIEHPSVVSYLDRVCSHVKAKDLHKDIRGEILSHLEELVSEKTVQGGKSEDAAIIEAIEQMGDPDRVGKQLHVVHKPKPEWSVLSLVLGMILIGLITLYAVDLSLNGSLLMERKLLFGFMGVTAMTVLYFLDYRRLLKYSWLLYGGTLLLMSAVHLQGYRINGNIQWLIIGSTGFNVYAVSPYLLIIAIAGILQREKLVQESHRKTLSLLARNTVICTLIPAMFYYTAHAYSYFIIYGLSLIVLLLVTGNRNLLFTGFGSFALIVGPLLFLKSTMFAYRWIYFTAFLHLEKDPQGVGFMTLSSVEAIQSGGMWGQGFGVVYRKLPLISGELIYSYLVYSFGWVFGIIVAAIVLLFILRIARMGLSLRDDYAKSLVVSLSVVLGIQFIWNLLMCTGFLPILGMTLPIMNWSSGTVIELAAVGLMLSAYRRKDMIGSSYHVSEN